MPFWQAVGGVLGSVANSVPGMGHVKGVFHYVAGDKEGGDEAMHAATRTTAVLGAGALGAVAGGPAGAIVGALEGGAITDIAFTAATGKSRGQIVALEKIRDGKTTEGILELTLNTAGDVMGGVSANSLVKSVTENTVKEAGKIMTKEEARKAFTGTAAQKTFNGEVTRIIIEKNIETLPQTIAEEIALKEVYKEAGEIMAKEAAKQVEKEVTKEVSKTVSKNVMIEASCRIVEQTINNSTRNSQALQHVLTGPFNMSSPGPSDSQSEYTTNNSGNNSTNNQSENNSNHSENNSANNQSGNNSYNSQNNQESNDQDEYSEEDQDEISTEGEESSSGESSEESSDEYQCHAVTTNGHQCTRDVVPGSYACGRRAHAAQFMPGNSQQRVGRIYVYTISPGRIKIGRTEQSDPRQRWRQQTQYQTKTDVKSWMCRDHVKAERKIKEQLKERNEQKKNANGNWIEEFEISREDAENIIRAIIKEINKEMKQNDNEESSELNSEYWHGQ